MISIKSKGGWEKTIHFLSRMLNGNAFDEMDRYGRMGVDALANATPKRSGETAASWRYRIINKSGEITIEWYNTNVNRGAVIALLIQYGHGTGTGGYVSGYDYINPAVRPVFDDIANEIWKKVTE